MSLSNKILIIFFGTILAYTLMAFAEIRIKGDTRTLTDENSITESIPLSNINYIYLNERFDQSLTISSGAEPKIKIRSKVGELLSNLDYETRNDTLFLTGFNDTEERFNLSIEVPKSGFNGFYTASGYIRLTDLQQENLSFTQSGGRLQIDHNIELGNLQISGSEKAYIDVYDASIDTVSLDLDHSDIRFNTSVNLIKGTLSNESDLYSSNASQLNLKRDKSSRMRIF